MSAPSLVYSCEIQVRWGDSDRLGHVNNTRIVEYLQEARSLFLAEGAASVDAAPGAAVVRKMDAEFLRPITATSGTVRVTVSVVHLGTSSFTLRHVIEDADGNVCASGDALMVAFDVRAERSRPLTEPERAVLGRYLPAAAPA
ncbi:acyl-CoA thioesterase [Rhodococcus sp. TAF43]|uniref:acyl-CoA thioesterase n=1 Tax=unclassified Rhodococcus (in: high G+C Gram-positive bacteria) TaxID=192944 RepID=UPI000E0B1966|nr:acyl-CoA thioesterase [Rhodococcus sp. AG1013]RDI32273.1 acyl-CoA thioester hydrolase [Rhodococcus sp. AG1013]